MEFHKLLQEDLLKATKSQNDTTKWVVRMLKSAIQLVEVEKGSQLDQNEFFAIVQKEIKTRKDAISDATRANRIDLIDSNKKELLVLEDYLPKQLSEEELTTLASQIIAETGADSLKDMGKVLKILIPILEGRATNQAASSTVKNLLSKNS